MSGVLHSVPDEDDPAGIVAAYRDATAPGSYLAITHATDDYRPDLPELTSAVYRQAGYRVIYRGRDRIAPFLDGYDLVDPGLVDAIHWRPESAGNRDPYNGDVARYSVYAALGCRR
jgi:hypothetical protein